MGFQDLQVAVMTGQVAISNNKTVVLFVIILSLTCLSAAGQGTRNSVAIFLVCKHLLMCLQ